MRIGLNQYDGITIEQVRLRGAERQLKLLSTEYINAKSTLHFLCLRCNHESKTISWVTLKNAKFGCKTCSKLFGIKKGGKKRKNWIPKTEIEWTDFLKKYNLQFHSVINSSKDKKGRVYKSVQFSCGNTFENSNEFHPLNCSRITNIERGIKKTLGKNCKYCTKPNLISNKNDINRSRDCERLYENLGRYANSIGAILIEGQVYNSYSKKYKFTKDGEEKLILAQNAIRTSGDPWTRPERVSALLSTKYTDLLDVCRLKKFKLITTENEYVKIIEFRSGELSPSNRKVKFEYQGDELTYPIGNIMRNVWFPKDNTVLEEIVRFAFESLFNFQFNFITSYPSGLVSVNGAQLELDGYCDNVQGYKIAFEQQGKQHESYRYNNRNLPNQKENDEIKIKWCDKNNIILIRIYGLGKTLNFDSLVAYIKNELQIMCPSVKTSNINGINYEELNKYIHKKMERKIKYTKDYCAKYGFVAEFDSVNEKGVLYFRIYSRSIQKSLKKNISSILKFSELEFIKMRKKGY